MQPYYSYKRKRSLNIPNILKSLPFIRNISRTRENQLIVFFFCLFLIVIIRLFQLQIIDHEKYASALIKQHTSTTSVLANRGDIYAKDQAWNPVKLTENITLYDIAIDPTMIGYTTSGVFMKDRLIELLTPVVYKHFCTIYGMNTPTPEECIQHIEVFTNKDLLPKAPELFYFGSGLKSPEYNTFDFAAFEESRQNTIANFTEEKAKELISQRLKEKIQTWIKPRNYLGMYTDPALLSWLRDQNFPFIDISYEYYIYVVPTKSINKTRDKRLLQQFFNAKGYYLSETQVDKLFSLQEYKYIKLFTSANPQIAQDIKDLKNQYYDEKSKDKVPVLHGIILEPYAVRYYPREGFMANILGYVDKNQTAYFGVEQYFDSLLRWVDGKIKGRSSSLVGSVGANEFEVENAKDGDDVFLTVDVGIQKEIESIAQHYLSEFSADSISILVYDPLSWQVKGMAQAPSFNPNNYNDAYELVPLGVEHAYLIDDLTYMDRPVYIMSGWTYKLTTLAERTDTSLPKYLPKNGFGSQVFMDRNVAVPFEPGSIFKALTMSIGMDTDEIRGTDYYDDPGEVKVWMFTIKNASSICQGYHSFLDGLAFSCNIAMIRIVQKIGKEIFYNYLEKFWFGKLTGIEIAEEKPGTLDNPSTVAMSRFLNTAFGQGIQVTQIQMAVAYAAIINGGKIIKPTIVSSLLKKSQNSDLTEQIQQPPQIIGQLMRSSVSDNMRWSLHQVMEKNPDYSAAIVSGYNLGAKSGTAQMAYRGRLQRGNGWTQATFVWVVSVDDPKYLVLIWVSRPRTSQWWVATGGRVFREVARFLIGYSLL